jgi:alpha-galactosidase
MSGDVYDFFTRPDDLCSCENASDPHCIAPGKHCSVLNIINRLAPYADRSKPGAWADMDMLEVGNGGMTDEEVRAELLLSHSSLIDHALSTKHISPCGQFSTLPSS